MRCHVQLTGDLHLKDSFITFVINMRKSLVTGRVAVQFSNE